MGVIGSSSGGYATLLPTQGNPVGEAMQNVENSAFKYRAEKREEDQQKAKQAQAQKEAMDAQSKDLIDYSSKHKIVPTTIDSVNKASLDFAIGNKNAYARAKGVLNTSSNPEERSKAMEALSNLDSAYEAYKSMPEMLNTSAKDLEEGVKAGKYNPNSSIEAAKTIKAMSDGSMKVVFGDDGIPKIITYQRDAKGNLTDIIDKELTTEQLKLKLSPITAYDADTNAQEFKKSLGDKIKTDSGTKTIEGYPGLVESAEKNANSVVSNRDKMYGIAPDAGVQPKFDLSDYTPEEIQKVKNYVKQSLTEKYKDSVTDNDAAMNRLQHIEDQKIAQANFDKDYNHKVKEFNEKSKKDEGNTTFDKYITTEDQTLDGVKVKKGSGVLTFKTPGYKDLTGAVRILEEAHKADDGTIVVGIRQKKVDYAKLTPEAAKQKKEDPKNFDAKDENNYQSPEKVVHYNLKTKGKNVSQVILSTQNPITGEKFKNQTEFENFVKQNAHSNSGQAKPKQKAKATPNNKENLRSKYNY